MRYCFDVRFRTPRPIGADKLEEAFEPAAFKRPLRLYKPDGMNTNDGWLAVGSCGYADFGEARASGTWLQDGLLITAAKQKVGVEFYPCGAVKGPWNVYPGGEFDLRDPGPSPPTILTDQELKEMVGAAVESATSLNPNQRVAAALLNDSFFIFKMSPEASLLVRVSAVEALCPQAGQTEDFRNIVDLVLASIPTDAPAQDRQQIEQALRSLAKRQSVRGACRSKIKQLLGGDTVKKFDDLYDRRSKFLHEGGGRGILSDAADAALEIGLALLLADIAHSAARPDRIISRKAHGYVFEVASVPKGTSPFAYGAKIAEMDRRLGRQVATYEVLSPFGEIFVTSTSVGRWQQLEEEHSGR